MNAGRLIVIRHDETTGDRLIAWATARGLVPEEVRPYRGERIEVDAADVVGTVVCGGPFSAFAVDDHPFLRDEDRWIAECLERDVPLLGICQGAQQLALHLGADHVGAPSDGRYEFGIYEVEPTQPGRELFGGPRHVPQSHYHTFNTPKSAVRLAGSELFEHQAFRYNRSFAFQFHAEAQLPIFRSWQDAQGDWYSKPGAQPRELQDELLERHDSEIGDWFFSAMDRIFGVHCSPAQRDEQMGTPSAMIV